MSSKFRTGDWYEMPLYYDIVFSSGTTDEADFLEAALQRFGRSGGRSVLEPACGTGRLVVEMTRRGFDVTGFDAAEAMLEFAELRLVQEQMRAALDLQRMESFSFPGRRFDLVHCLLSTFKYLLDEDAARGFLQHASDHLEIGGLFVLGVHLADYGDGKIEHERWTGERDGVEVVCNTRTWPPDHTMRRERLRNRLTVVRAGAIERWESSWDCRTYSRSELIELVGSVGSLEVVACYDFHHDIDSPVDVDEAATEVVLVLRRI